MKKLIITAMAAAALGVVAEDKVWPANYWSQVVPELVAEATPTGDATASATVNLDADTVSYASSSYTRALEARMQLMFGSSNTVANFSSFPPGTIFSLR